MGFRTDYILNLAPVALGRQPTRPLLFSYYVTHRCELNCSYCSDGDGKRFKEERVPELSTGRARELITILRKAAGVLDVTGVGLKFVTIVTNLSMGFLPLTLLLVMVSCLVLGMGVPTAPAYIVVAMIAAPTLTQMGIEPIAAHMFVFYSALLSAITPPVALAAYAGAAISGGNVMRTAVIATKLGFVSFVVPYLFVYNNALLGLGSTSAVAWTFTTGVVGVITVAVAFQGQLFARLELYLRVLLAITGLAILHHSLPLNIGALLVLALVVLFLKRQSKRQDVVSEPIT